MKRSGVGTDRLIEADKEYGFKFKTLDVPDVEHPNITIISDDLSVFARNGRETDFFQPRVKLNSEGHDLFLVVDEDSDRGCFLHHPINLLDTRC